MPPVRQRNVQPPQLGRILHRGDGAHRLLGPADIAAPARRFLLHQPQAARDIDGGHIQRCHFGWVQFHAHLTVDPAHAFDGAEPGHAQQAFGNGVIDKPAQLLIVESAVGCRGGGKC